MGYQSPLRVSSQKLSSFKAKYLLSVFLQAAVASLILGIDFWRIRITVAPETSKIMFAYMAVAQSATKPSLPSFFKHTAGPPALPKTTRPLPTPLAKGSQVNSFQSISQGNQSIVDPPHSILPATVPIPTQPISDSLPADVKLLL
jgi:hypothetical protein